MKLYTEEQLIQAIKWAQKCDHDCGGVYFYYETSNDILEDLTPIQLPSDEEINEVAMIVYGFDARDINDVLEYKAFKRGAKWMRDKIQGGNNE